MPPRLMSFTDHELDTLLELIRVAKIGCQAIGSQVARTFPDSPLIERMRIYGELADDVAAQIRKAQE
jgi:hypothetical protein